MSFKFSYYFLMITLPFFALSMENTDKKTAFDVDEMLESAIRPANDSLRNIVTKYFVYNSEFTIEDIQNLDIPETLIHEIVMRKKMLYIKRSPKVNDNYDDLDFNPKLKEELTSRKRELFNSLINKIESDENLKKIYGDIIEGIKESGDINFRPDSEYQAIIHTASGKGNLDILKYAIALGADAQLPRLCKFQPIHNFKSIDIADCLLREGCNINALDEKNRTPLMFICSLTKYDPKDLIEKALFLLQRGCNVNFKNNAGNTALMFAAHYGQKELAQLFLQYGAQINDVNDKGKTAKDHVRDKKNRELYNIL